MRVYRTLEEIGPEARDCAVCIGNFDGVHVGHRKILRDAVALCIDNGWKPSVLTFDPHPTKVVAPHRAPKLLTRTEERLQAFADEEIEQAFVLSFDTRFSEMTPETFVRRVLVEAAGARAVLVGENFRFGNKQAGDVDTLRQLGQQFGFDVHITPGVRMRGRWVSSSEVRAAVEQGNVAIACRFLGRPYAVGGPVVTGHGIGSKQTVPTLNLATQAEVIPARGVYITRTREPGSSREWDSITNIGVRPTFDGQDLTIETYLLTPFTGERPERISVEFLRRVRDERKFDSPESLKSQIMRDVGRAQSYFRRFHALAAKSTVVD